jgi:hypothetical protein
MSNLSAGSKLPALAYLSDLAIKKPGTTDPKERAEITEQTEKSLTGSFPFVPLFPPFLLDP